MEASLPITNFGAGLDQWLVEEVVTRRGRDGWFRVSWRPMRVKESDVERVKVWDGRPLSGPVKDLQDGSCIIYFGDSWLAANELSPEWVAVAESAYHFLCPECALAFPTKQTLRTHWQTNHAADDTATTLRNRGLQGVTRSRTRDICTYFKQCLRVKILNKIRYRATQPEMGCKVAMDFNEVAFYMLCVLPEADIASYLPDTGPIHHRTMY
jgi:hypothetical protein